MCEKSMKHILLGAPVSRDYAEIQQRYMLQDVQVMKSSPGAHVVSQTSEYTPPPSLLTCNCGVGFVHSI